MYDVFMFDALATDGNVLQAFAQVAAIESDVVAVSKDILIDFFSTHPIAARVCF